MNDLTNQVVLVTGAGRGVGRTIAEAFAAQGAIVAANDITPVNLDQTIENIAAAGWRAKDYIADISKKMPVQALLNEILDDWGRLDILVNNANVNPRGELLELGEWDWRRTIDVNLTGPFLTSQSAGRVMKAAGGGTMINIICHQGHAAYNASVMGLFGLTLAAAQQFAAHNIRVYALADIPAAASIEHEELSMDIPQAALYLCSRSASRLDKAIILAKE
jgi:NAD(P)-dependent dehydrogenase (short-subunit alcohol dehydrogenase family)